jgi:hypothetical protein
MTGEALNADTIHFASAPFPPALTLQHGQREQDKKYVPPQEYGSIGKNCERQEGPSAQQVTHNAHASAAEKNSVRLAPRGLGLQREREDGVLHSRSSNDRRQKLSGSARRGYLTSEVYSTGQGRMANTNRIDLRRAAHRPAPGRRTHVRPRPGVTSGAQNLRKARTPGADWCCPLKGECRAAVDMPFPPLCSRPSFHPTSRGGGVDVVESHRGASDVAR